MHVSNWRWYKPLLRQHASPLSNCNCCDGRGWDIVMWTGQLEVRACQACHRYDHLGAALEVIKLGVLCSPEYPHRIEEDDLMQPWSSRI